MHRITALKICHDKDATEHVKKITLQYSSLHKHHLDFGLMTLCFFYINYLILTTIMLQLFMLHLHTH